MTRSAWIVLAVIAAVVVAGVLVMRQRQQDADDARSDAFYCTLSGVGPMDRGPRTGRLCADLLDDD